MCGNAPVLQMDEDWAGSRDVANRGRTGELIPLQEAPVSSPVAKCLGLWSEMLFFFAPADTCIVTATW